jgi:hypothetical protein
MNAIFYYDMEKLRYNENLYKMYEKVNSAGCNCSR